jgi:hypothetical protein
MACTQDAGSQIAIVALVASAGGIRAIGEILAGLASQFPGADCVPPAPEPLPQQRLGALVAVANGTAGTLGSLG